MPAKDIMEKTLEAFNDVFADIVNGLLFDGEPLVTPESLTDAQPFSFYSIENEARWQDRDVAKFWQGDARIRLALVGFENQTRVDRNMPFRVIGYDGAAYRWQVSEGEERYPVITLVLYFGRQHWDKRGLWDYLQIPERLKPFVQDYRINVFEIAYLTDEQIGRFRSDFRIVADYFAHSRTDPDYRPTDPKKFEHTNELLKLMSAVTGDNTFVELIDGEGGAPGDMCEVLERVKMQGREEGLQEGRTEGRAEGRTQGREQQSRAIALNLREKLGMTDPNEIAQLVDMPAELVERWLAEGQGAGCQR